VALAGTTAEVGVGATAADLYAANRAALDTASLAGVSITSRLVGYDYDAAFPTLLRQLLRPGITWFVLAAIFGAVVSSLASMLNSASTIATMDIYRKLKKHSSQFELVTAGRVFVVLFVLIAVLIAPNLGRPEFGGIFTFIQEFQGFISPGVLAVFLFGFLIHKAPRYLGWLGIVANAVLYGILKIAAPDIAFLNRMAICFGAVLALLTILSIVNPLSKPVDLPTNEKMDLTSSPGAKFWGGAVVVATLALYVIFW